ncbi:hypothetical protein SteCoe_18804 [Stentor coeruleus]|uniref:Uncharacterized protein n=1 Tax=Stentor coeruleus TaxID=5963 RepID=A0A1R2BVR1_9CILI|nr:hypothetical protein SteCoe_18804 [Stentor coeruleus]
MNNILICPDKKKDHKNSHQLISEKVKEIREVCSTKYYKGRKSLKYGRHWQAYKRWLYHMHPKVDDNNPYSKLYSRLPYSYSQNLSEKYRTYNLPKKKSIQEFNDEKINFQKDDKMINPKEDEKYFGNKKYFSKGKTVDDKKYRKCVSVEKEIISMYFEW